ncbi:mechanosensitive ion channel [Caldichromatium japonicum]|uniref:Mechanosensitive ion channel n=1 Tax=Caldichromatium japonicum TaxID=2699430 RepID=A0A6G7VCP0_9GAMM|nr:mechanosensitive ion channel domain-containing protein [Caldichromatium japonicum]QIK37734.1 mechanosensitive ion channel [Caldichromatium japonicum]
MNPHTARYAHDRHPWLAICALLYLFSAAFTPGAQAETAAKTDTLPSRVQVEQQMRALEASAGVDEGLKGTLLELYRRTLSHLADLEKFEARSKELTQTLKSAPRRLAELQRALEQRLTAGSPKPPPVAEGLSVDQLSQQLNQVLADSAAAEIRVNEFAKKLEDSQMRSMSVRERLSTIKQTIDDLDRELRQEGSSVASPELVSAKRWASESQRQALISESRLLEQELLAQPTEHSLLKVQHDLAALDLRDLRVRQRVLEESLQSRRAQQAQAEQLASERAQRAAEDKHPVVRAAIQRNAELTTAFAANTERLSGLSALRAAIEEDRKRIEDEYRGARQRLEAVGLTRALGQVLLDQRNALPDLRQYRAQIREREDQIAEATLRQIRYREEERRLHDLDRYLAEISATEPAVRDKAIERELVETLKQRRNLLRQVIKGEDDYIRQLNELNYGAEQLIKVAREYESFLAENLLWVRSASAIDLDTLSHLSAALGGIIAIEGWGEVVSALGERLSHAPVFWIGLALGLLLIWKNPALRRAIRDRAEPVRRVRTDSIRYTLEALGLTLVAALPSALLCWLIGQQLLASPLATPFTRALGAGLTQVAFGLYCLRAFRILCMSGGVADRHFRWKEHSLLRVRREFGWFTLYITPFAFVTAALYQYNDPDALPSLGRLALIASLLGCSLFIARLLHPTQGAIKHFLLDHPEGWIQRLRRLWFPLVVGIPLILAGMAIAGYIYTVWVLFQAMVYQLWVALGLTIVHQVIVRWLSLTRRRIALQTALARLTQSEEAREHPEISSESFQVSETEPNLAMLDEQTRQLLNAAIFIAGFLGFWATWSEVLPALKVLERFTLWHYAGMVNGVAQQVPFTLADLSLIILIIAVAALAIRNLPALFEILLLQGSDLSPSARYTIKTLSGYGIAAAAAILTFGALGLSWGQIQWLVAALSVGIGFGLQEIIGNFISGLIILFERPVRVGDIVTIGNTTGVVTNIRIRATTIRNWDRQELLVPNKEFITGRLLNWTLSDQQNRITIIIGIEYGGDVRKALHLLEQIARAHPKILDDPEPLVGFEEFGENGLMLKLRCYMGSLEGRIGVVTELNQAIYETFRAEGIPLAFPQRDVRLYAPEPLAVRLERDKNRPIPATWRDG